MRGRRVTTSGPQAPRRPSRSGASGTAGAGATRINLGPGLTLGGDATSVVISATTLLLVGFGLIMVLSSSSITSYLDDRGFFGAFWNQALYAVVGLPLMFVAANLPVTFWRKWAWALFALGLALQVLVFTPLGVESYGNRNWIQIGSFSGQPSEPLKLALIVWIGAVLYAKQPLLGQKKHVFIPVIFPGALAALGLVLMGKDLGTVLIMGGVVIGALFFAGIDWKSLGIIVAGAALTAFLFVVTSENRMNRLFGHATGNDDYSGLGWQPLHGLWALAGGGVFGVGLGGSKAKWSWLPAADNDYIFAIIGEELGLIGACLVIVLYAVLAVMMLRVIRNARDIFGRAVVGGVLVWVVGQALVNIAVVVGILPVLGVPLPLLSSGGTALIAVLGAMGVVLSVARDAAAYQEELAAER
ncbi:cell division protein FtsW [Leucobacter sp. cx-87]|nr:MULTISPECIES: putative peptidoglycan glycosyltransferase FtsW [unclassified Leucobacter]MBC9935114.1 cell division protein FtsW [Leucobacter sp. cx-87]